MTSSRARSSSYLRAAFGCALVLFVSMLFLARPAATPSAADDVSAMLAAVERMALVFPGPSSPKVAPFFLDRFETTNGDFLDFVRATRYRPQDAKAFLTHLPFDPFGGASETLDPGNALLREPVRFVSVEDARAYAAWRHTRLPTSAEWIVAARTVTDLDSPAVKDSESRYRWNLLETGLDKPVRVGTFEGGRTPRSDAIAPPVYDLIGNVAEWVEPDGTVPARGEVAILGGSFIEPAGRVRARFAEDFGLPVDRNAAVGFRCGRGDAESWLRKLIMVLAKADRGQVSLARESLSRLGRPLERLLRVIRFREATAGFLPITDPPDVGDRFLPAIGGRFLRLHRRQAELLDPIRGIVASAPGLGAFPVAAVAVTPANSRYLLTERDPSDHENDRIWLWHDASGSFALFDSTVDVVLAADSPVSLSGIVPPSRFLPDSILASLLRLTPSQCPDTAGATRILDLSISGDRIDLQTLAVAGAAEDLLVDAERGIVYAWGTIQLGWPDFDPAWPHFPAIVSAVYALSLDDGRLRGASLVPWNASAAARCSAQNDRLMVFDAGGWAAIDGLASGRPVVTRRGRLPDESLRVRRATGLRNGGVLVEAQDWIQSRLLLLKLDADGQSLAGREFDTSGPLVAQVRTLGPDDEVLLLDSEGAMHRLDSALADTWRSAEVGFSVSFCDPLRVDFDGDGTEEFAVPGGDDSIALLDFGTGVAIDRISTEGFIVLALTNAGVNGPPGALVAGVQEQGIFRLRAAGGVVDGVARELLRELARPVAAKGGP